MKYINSEELREKNDPDFNQTIQACERFGFTDIMAFRYDWNIEVLTQFHATYFYKRDTDEIHWMIEGCHYCVDFITFSRLLGFDEEHRGFSYIHDERRAEAREIVFHVSQQ